MELAAEALGCEPARIAKTLSFLLPGGPILVVAAWDTKIENRKFRAEFGAKPKMIPADLVEKYTGHVPGGVCPFAVKENVRIYLDKSLKRFSSVYPAAGSDRSAVEMTCAELEKYTPAEKWVDVCSNQEKTGRP